MKITSNDIRKQNRKHNLSRILLATALLAAPLTTFAYNPTLSNLVVKAIQYFNQAVYVIIAIAIVTFVWNIYHYFIVADPENKKEASLYVMYSVIGLFVILSFWGLVNIVSNTFDLNTTSSSINIQGLVGGNSSNNTFGGY
jgi:hypothetical protein